MRVNADAYARMVARIVQMPASTAELAEESGLHPRTVSDQIKAMRKHKAVHVAGWGRARDGSLRVAIYGIGNRPDAKRTPKRRPPGSGKPKESN